MQLTVTLTVSLTVPGTFRCTTSQPRSLGLNLINHTSCRVTIPPSARHTVTRRVFDLHFHVVACSCNEHADTLAGEGTGVRSSTNARHASSKSLSASTSPATVRGVWSLLQWPVGSENVRMDRVSHRLGGKGRTTPAGSSVGTGRSSHTPYQIQCGLAGSGRCHGCWRLCGHCCMNLR